MPENAMTMIGLLRLNNIQECVNYVLENNIPGDFIETGSCKGGAVIFMRACLKAHGIEDRKVYSCDTFSSPTPPGNFILHNIILGIVWLLGEFLFFSVCSSLSFEHYNIVPEMLLYFICSPLFFFLPSSFFLLPPATIPFLWWRRALLRFVMKVNPEFPADDNPDDDEMNALVFIMKHAYLMKARPGVTKGLKSVQSNFAR